MRLRLGSVLACAVLLPLSGCGSNAPQTSPGSTAAPATSSAASPSASSAPTPSGSGASGGAACPPAGGAAKRTVTFDAPPPMCIDPAKSYTATVTTDVGAFTVALDAKKAPKTVNNFVFLARNHFYDGVTFHRVIQGFMAQGGDPQGTGAGGPGYEFEDELPQPGEYRVGSVAMANAGPNTNGSQFFVVTGEAGVGLPPHYSLFGTVTGGMDVVKKIEADGSPADGPPAKVHTMKTVTVKEG
ncbi:peptidylprolyl isomerase [Agilicoccus flavus]|uniref:peptidylprolyl isomerase n=1 Tax=Agilicoccus flavus TaxID=2775968 RepID=UPI0027DA54B3|nr:peptidylprolyl isomerase [Agilicoccus flavus]